MVRRFLPRQNSADIARSGATISLEIVNSSDYRNVQYNLYFRQELIDFGSFVLINKVIGLDNGVLTSERIFLHGTNQFFQYFHSL